jgi:DNA modification methylase
LEDVLIIHGDSLEELKKLDAGSVDSIVTDPPYGLSALSPAQISDVIAHWARGDLDYMPRGAGFMNKSWDVFVPPPALWVEALRVLKEGGHALVFAGSRTQDLMGLSLRLAGFEMRDVIQWIYGSGFPKSHNVSKAIDKSLGVEREVVGFQKMTGTARKIKGSNELGHDITASATDGAKQYEGWGTALKPAYEPCLLVRKPIKGTVADNVLRHGTGALNIGGCRIETDEVLGRARGGWGDLAVGATNYGGFDSLGITKEGGRWPSNVIFDEESAPLLGETARFFYCAKASKGEREAGLENLPSISVSEINVNKPQNIKTSRKNIHPTVKPIDLMRYLVRLVTPTGGIVLDPFTGSGSTGCGCALEKAQFIGIERELQYVEIARARIAHWSGNSIVYETPKNEREDDYSDLPLFGGSHE